MPEYILRNVANSGQVPAVPRLFLECDRQGRVLWMTEQARERLGSNCHLSETFVPAPRLQEFLESGRNRETLRGMLLRPGKTPLPVELSCMLRAPGRTLLAVQVNERTTDRTEEYSDDLAALQRRTLENYFRLLRLQQSLDSRSSRARRNPATAITEQLERERARLARELHTGAGQALSAIKVHVELIQGSAPELPAEVRRYLDRITQLARDAASEVSAVSRRLHPLDWQGMSLVEALRKLWNKSGIPERFQGSLSLSELPTEPPHPVRVALYRIAQESLSNIIRHSGASRIALFLSEAGGSIRLSIEDNGKGFDFEDQSSVVGLGLRTIRDQVRNLDGDLRLRSDAEGTKLEVTIPFDSSDE